MATVQVTGTLADFGRGSLAARSPELIFTPSAATTTISDGYLLAAVPITATLFPGGFFTVGLEESENTTDGIHYTAQIRLLDPDAGYIYVDFIDWKIVVPNGGGQLRDMGDSRATGAVVWTVPDGEIPAEARPNDLLLDTTTYDLFRLG